MANPKAAEFARQLETLTTTTGTDPLTIEDNEGRDYKWFRENRASVSIPKWSPRPLNLPPASPKKSSVALKAGAGLERSAIATESKKKEREQREGEK